ncbi:MAG: HEAT repeat domain-containing protein [Pyrinomonadaceae bacterium]
MKNNVTKLNRINKMFAIAFVLIAGGLINQAVAQQYSHRPKASKFTQQGSNNAANTVFNGGRDLIDDAQWTRAEEKFAQYIAAYPQEKNLDAALYWMAYAQSKLKKFEKSKDTLQKLLKTYQKTVWKEDAELLLGQLPTNIAVKVDPVIVDIDKAVAIAPVAIAAPQVVVTVAPPQDPIRAQELQERMAEQQARAIERQKEAQERMQERIDEAQERAKAISLYGVGRGAGLGIGIGDNEGPDDDPCEFKIVVLQALVENDPQRGLAVANDWLKAGSAQTPSCKRAALRVLSRHGGKAALPTILSIAQTETDLKIKTTAISLLGASNDDSVVSALRDFAINSPQPEVGEAALYALSQHTSPQALNALTDIALSTKPIAFRKTAIRAISGRPGEPAVDALFKIYDSSQDLEIRKSVVSGFGNRKSERAGAKLVEIARGSDIVELRLVAIRSIGNRGGAGAVDMLMGLFDTEKDEKIKDQIMNALASSQDKKVTLKLIEIAKNPQTPIERRRRAIMLLSSRGKDPDVINYLESLLKQ